MTEESGDAACWAGELQPDGLDGRPLVTSDLDDTPGTGGVVWHLPPGLDLNANLVRLDAGQRLPEHRNDEVDVLIVVRGGSAELVVDHIRHVLSGDTVALIPRGTTREISAGPNGIAYLSVHRQRGGPAIRSK